MYVCIMAKGRKPAQEELNDKINGMTGWVIQYKTFTGLHSLCMVIAKTNVDALNYAVSALKDPGAKVVDKIRDITIVA